MNFLEETNANNKILLTQVRTKILEITTGAQEHQLNDQDMDQRVKNADLETLLKLKSNLENEIATFEGCISSFYIY